MPRVAHTARRLLPALRIPALLGYLVGLYLVRHSLAGTFAVFGATLAFLVAGYAARRWDERLNPGPQEGFSGSRDFDADLEPSDPDGYDDGQPFAQRVQWVDELAELPRHPDPEWVAELYRIARATGTDLEED